MLTLDKVIESDFTWDDLLSLITTSISIEYGSLYRPDYITRFDLNLTAGSNPVKNYIGRYLSHIKFSWTYLDLPSSDVESIIFNDRKVERYQHSKRDYISTMGLVLVGNLIVGSVLDTITPDLDQPYVVGSLLNTLTSGIILFYTRNTTQIMTRTSRRPGIGYEKMTKREVFRQQYQDDEKIPAGDYSGIDLEREIKILNAFELKRPVFETKVTPHELDPSINILDIFLSFKAGEKIRMSSTLYLNVKSLDLNGERQIGLVPVSEGEMFYKSPLNKYNFVTTFNPIISTRYVRATFT